MIADVRPPHADGDALFTPTLYDGAPMRYRAEKTTKQIENDELSRLTEATTQGGEGRPTTQLDPDALRALLGTDEMVPVAPPRPVEAPMAVGSVVVEPPPVVIEPPPPVAVEPPPAVLVEAPGVRRSRWPVVALCVVVVGAAAAFATTSLL